MLKLSRTWHRIFKKIEKKIDKLKLMRGIWNRMKLILTTLVLGCMVIMVFHWQVSFLKSFGRKEADSKRQKLVQRGCENFNLTGKSIYEIDNDVMQLLLVDEERELLFCAVPYAGDSHWKKILANNFRTLSEYRYKEKEEILQKYKKFLIVRNPFERLLSIYLNEYKSRKISLNTTIDTEFQQFIKTILSPDVKSKYEQWKPIEQICRPCIIKYDVIGKYETIKEDSNYVLGSIGLEPNFQIETLTKVNKSELTNYYKKLPDEMLGELQKLYRRDSALFGYQFDKL